MACFTDNGSFPDSLSIIWFDTIHMKDTSNNLSKKLSETYIRPSLQLKLAKINKTNHCFNFLFRTFLKNAYLEFHSIKRIHLNIIIFLIY